MTPLVNMEVLMVMPSIRAAMAEIDAHAATRRVTIIRHPGPDTDLLRYWLDRALEGSCSERLVRAAVSGGSNVAMMVANAAQIQSLTPATQASDACNGRRVNVLLSPLDEGATASIEDYVVAFIRALNSEQSEGIRLYVVDAHLRHAVGTTTQMSVVQLTDLLSREEMAAYVALRMTGRTGPSCTHLARALVERFAGADPRMAEALMGLTDDQLLNLPSGVALSQLPPMPSAGRQQLAGESDPLVLLYEYHAQDAVRRAAAAKQLVALHRHACVQSLMPWLEECRIRMVEILRPALEGYQMRMGGLYRGTKDRDFQIEVEQVEFNDIYSFEKYRDFRLAADWPQHTTNLSACFTARQIRNGIAHSGGLRIATLLADLAQVQRAFGAT